MGDVSLHHSDLAYYVNGEQVDDCSRDLVKPRSGNPLDAFSKNLKLTPTTVGQRSLCPILFTDAYLAILTLSHNRDFRFDITNYATLGDLNATVVHLTLDRMQRVD